jgi:serine/threonine-protein kinase
VEVVALTSYSGKSGEQALNELNDLGFNVESTYTFNEKILSGVVISQTPAGVDVAPKGSTVVLVISKGSQYVFIPNVFSLDQIKATQALQDLQLKVVVKKLGTKKVKKVTNISPKVGTKVKRGSVVTITVG